MIGRTVDIAKKLKGVFIAFYGVRLIVLVVYGSYARGEADEESDLVVLDRVEHYAAEVDRTSEIVGSLSLEYSVSISRVFISQNDWRTGDSPFLRNVRSEAIPL